jgi:hypothetical protein
VRPEVTDGLLAFDDRAVRPVEGYVDRLADDRVQRGAGKHDVVSDLEARVIEPAVLDTGRRDYTAAETGHSVDRSPGRSSVVPRNGRG